MNIETIESIKHPLIQEARALTKIKNRIQHKKCLVFNTQGIEWALKNHHTIEAIFVTKEIADDQLKKYLYQEIPCYRLSDGIMQKMTEKKYTIPLVALIKLKQVEPWTPDNLVVVLDNVVDPGNIGTIARTAKAFGIHALLTTQKDFDFLSPKTIDASRGSVFALDWHYFENSTKTLEALRKKDYFVIATSPHAQQLQGHIELPPSKPIALVIGNEHTGISKEFEQSADALIQIPMSSSIESLNVGVAAGISLYEIKLKLVLSMLKKQIYTSLGRQINVTGKLIQQAFDKAVRKVTKLSGQHIILLMILKCDQTMTLQQVSKDTALFGEQLENFLNPLLVKKYIKKNSQGISLTENGELFLAQLWPTKEAVEEKILEGFSKKEKQQLELYLDRLQKNCLSIID